MPPGDLPVTIAHVANVTRSAASRGGTSAPSASVTASWVSTPCAARVGRSAASVGRARLSGTCRVRRRRRDRHVRSRCGRWCFGAASARARRPCVAPPMQLGLRGRDLLGVCVFWCSASSSTSSRCSIAYSISFSTAYRLASRTAVSWIGGRSKSYSTRFLIRTAISESRPSSISGTSHGRSSGS